MSNDYVYIIIISLIKISDSFSRSRFYSLSGLRSKISKFEHFFIVFFHFIHYMVKRYWLLTPLISSNIPIILPKLQVWMRGYIAGFRLMNILWIYTQKSIFCPHSPIYCSIHKLIRTKVTSLNLMLNSRCFHITIEIVIGMRFPISSKWRLPNKWLWLFNLWSYC